MKKVLILVNGEYGDYSFCKEWQKFDKIICADNGMKHARTLGIVPDLIVGDFDSSNPEDLNYYKELGVQIEQFDPHKDATDTELAVKRGVSFGASKITIWGGAGTRLDHTLANVQLLYQLLMQGIEAELINPYNHVFLVKDYGRIKGRKGDLVSLIPFAGEVTGITTKCLAYPLEKATMSLGTSLGVSNVLVSDEAEIWLESGILIVILARD